MATHGFGELLPFHLNGIKTNLHPVKSKGPQQGVQKTQKTKNCSRLPRRTLDRFTQRLLDGHSGWKEHEHQNQCMGSDPHPETLYIPISVYFESIVGSATSKPRIFFEIKFVCLNHIYSLSYTENDGFDN